jgi:phosphoribosyl-ATP pyrophosphohydrolase
VSDTVAPEPDLGEVLSEVYAQLEERKRTLPPGSYTAELLSGPPDRLLKKLVEESSEVILAARDRDAEALKREVCDVLYHLLVVMVREGVTPEDVAAEMQSRRKP